MTQLWPSELYPGWYSYYVYLAIQILKDFYTVGLLNNCCLSCPTPGQGGEGQWEGHPVTGPQIDHHSSCTLAPFPRAPQLDIAPPVVRGHSGRHLALFLHMVAATHGWHMLEHSHPLVVACCGWWMFCVDCSTCGLLMLQENRTRESLECVPTSDGPWLLAGKNSSACRSRVKVGLFRQIHSP